MFLAYNGEIYAQLRCLLVKIQKGFLNPFRSSIKSKIVCKPTNFSWKSNTIILLTPISKIFRSPTTYVFEYAQTYSSSLI